uniref:N-acetyltransferase domain-containing protein n=1 Tax=viral metagenome TaxID=1070528 RepID=A0A6C0K1K6_9ZZZZ
MKSKIVLRPVRYMDIPGMIRVNEECLQENYDRPFWEQQYHLGKNHTFVAVDGKEVIGYLLCNGELVVSLALREAYRRKGIGKQLFHHCLNSFRSVLKPCVLNLHVRVSNKGAIALYTSLEFEIHETVPRYYLQPVEDAFHMRALLSPSMPLREEKKKMNVELSVSMAVKKN